MDVFEAILSRRSIRKFQAQPVAQEKIDALVAAAFNAASAFGERSWHVVVMRDRARLDAIPEFHPHAKMLLEAPLGMAVCTDLKRDVHRPGMGYWIQDCAAATQNILLAATAQGLGSCWIGIHPRPERKEALRKLLGLPDHIEPFCVIALGYPNEIGHPPDACGPDRVHYDRW